VSGGVTVAYIGLTQAQQQNNTALFILINETLIRSLLYTQGSLSYEIYARKEFHYADYAVLSRRVNVEAMHAQHKQGDLLESSSLVEQQEDGTI
jgi:hypothetical protein